MRAHVAVVALCAGLLAPLTALAFPDAVVGGKLVQKHKCDTCHTEKVYGPPAHWAFNNSRITPGFDKPRVCGGASLSGTAEGTILQIDSLLTSEPVPSAEYVLSRPWLWFYGVAVNSSGQPSYMTLGDGEGGRVPIKVPLITRLPVYVPLAWLHMLPAGYDAATHDPLKLWA